MAAVATVSDATSLEGQVLSFCREIVQAEDAWIAAGLALTPPVQRTRRFTITPNLAAGTITISGSLPLNVADAANGMALSAGTYLP